MDNIQTGCVATAPPPPPKEPEPEPSTRWKLAAAGEVDDLAAAGGGALGNVELVDDDSADDPMEAEMPVETTRVERLKKGAVSPGATS